MTDPHIAAARVAAMADSLDAAGHYDGADALRRYLAGESLEDALNAALGVGPRLAGRGAPQAPPGGAAGHPGLAAYRREGQRGC